MGSGIGELRLRNGFTVDPERDMSLPGLVQELATDALYSLSAMPLPVFIGHMPSGLRTRQFASSLTGRFEPGTKEAAPARARRPELVWLYLLSRREKTIHALAPY